MTQADETLLEQVRRGLSVPFADPVSVHGLPISRATARAMERMLSRARKT